MPLEDYKEVVASVAKVVTIGQFFAPVFICLDIVKKGNTKDVDPMPFVGGLVMSVLMLQYGTLLNDSAMIQVNIFGFGLGLLYLIIYYLYAIDRSDLHSKLGKAMTLLAVLLGYVRVEQESNVEFRFGGIVTILMLLLIGAPLLQLGDIVKKQSTAGLPFPLILSGTVVTFSWLLYGIIINNIFMQVQNVVAFLLCITQLSLFAIYPNRSADEIETKKRS